MGARLTAACATLGARDFMAREVPPVICTEFSELLRRAWGVARRVHLVCTRA
jgi:hypothetical protein